MITTKWFPLLKRAKTISKSADKSTKNLDPFQIDLYLVHQPYSISSIEEQMDAMVDLVESGKIRAVGVSNFSTEKMIAAHKSLSERGVPLAANQMRYSLLDRRIEYDGVLDAAKELGISIIAYTPLEQGILAGKFHRNPESLNDIQFIRKRMIKKRLKKSQLLVETLESIGLEHEVTAAQVSLNWITKFHGDVLVAIPGSTKAIQAEQNAKAMNLKLSSEEMETIDTVSLNI